LPLAVVEECTFDRGEVSHKINLFDMQAKYADVVSLADTLAFIRTRTQAPVREAAAV
jgi:hypothetical protein